jgi:hypothetical protein
VLTQVNRGRHPTVEAVFGARCCCLFDALHAASWLLFASFVSRDALLLQCICYACNTPPNHKRPSTPLNAMLSFSSPPESRGLRRSPTTTLAPHRSKCISHRPLGGEHPSRRSR